jgi:hypothetical protein
MKVDTMAGLDDLFSQIPVADIASRLGAPEGEVNQAIQTLVPTLVGGIQHSVVSDDIDSSTLESAIATEGGSGLLDGGVNVDQVDAGAGEQLVARIFGGNDTNQVASAMCWAASSAVNRAAPSGTSWAGCWAGRSSAGHDRTGRPPGRSPAFLDLSGDHH